MMNTLPKSQLLQFVGRAWCCLAVLETVLDSIFTEAVTLVRRWDRTSTND